MKKVIILILATLCLVFSLTGCRQGDVIDTKIDVASSKNFRAEVEMSVGDKKFTLGENDSAYLFESCYEAKDKGQRLKADKVAIGTDFIKIYFVGDCVDNAPTKNEKADYGAFIIFSNNVVRFEYDTVSQYYQFESGFFSFINTYITIFAAK